MKRWVYWSVFAIVISLIAMLGINLKQTREVQKDVQFSDVQLEKSRTADDLVLSLERFRRKSATFRKIPDEESAAIKARLADEMRSGLARLETADAQPQERALIDQTRNTFGEFSVLSAKLEPTLFLRDVYQKTQIQDLHDSMIRNLGSLAKYERGLASQRRGQLGSVWDHDMRWLALAACLVVFFVLAVLFRCYRTYVRPLRSLRFRAREYGEGKIPPVTQRPLPKEFAEIEAVLKDLSVTVQTHRAENQNFVTAVAMELRAPLLSLQSSRGLFAQASSQAAAEPNAEGIRGQAKRVLETSLFRLSRALEDLTDIVETDYSKIHLNETIVDARDLVGQTAHALNGPESRYEVAVSVPSSPIWISVDAQRIERVFVNLISKVMQLTPKGGKIQMLVSQPPAGGLEVMILEGDRSEKRPAGSGPELDLIRHWVSQNGFGMSLAHKIMKVHGGSITASGVAGSRVAFTLKLPKNRVATGSLTPSWVRETEGRLETRLDRGEGGTGGDEINPAPLPLQPPSRAPSR